MAPTNEPTWFRLSYRARYKRLNKVFRKWFSRHHNQEAVRGRTIHLDGSWITDVPSFYLSIGEAVNGRDGYFGTSLDALDDCLCGSFGVLPPLTIHLSHYNRVRAALDCRSWIRFRAEAVRDILECVYTHEELELLGYDGYFGDCSETDMAKWKSIYTAALNCQPFECNGHRVFFDVLLEVLTHRGAILLPDV